jgi:hypothetical protein
MQHDLDQYNSSSSEWYVDGLICLLLDWLVDGFLFNVNLYSGWEHTQ